MRSDYINDEEMYEVINHKVKNWADIEFYCGWCESYMETKDIYKKRYKPFLLKDDKFIIVCLKCLDKFEEIKSLKEY